MRRSVAWSPEKRARHRKWVAEGKARARQGREEIVQEVRESVGAMKRARLQGGASPRDALLLQLLEGNVIAARVAGKHIEKQGIRPRTATSGMGYRLEAHTDRALKILGLLGEVEGAIPDVRAYLEERARERQRGAEEGG